MLVQIRINKLNEGFINKYRQHIHKHMGSKKGVSAYLIELMKKDAINKKWR